ncbi:MAG: hypothetical protein COB01_11945 [Lutibacter sp.]|nr:MAG: hypothetical protein COB01_11945 [Lutibacter sp.]
MYDDTKAYFLENVFIPFKEYLKLKKIKKSGLSVHLRSAINSASNLYHLREHIPNNGDLSRNKLTKICPDYGLLGDVVNASKHRVLNKNNPQVSNSKNIYEQIIITEYKDKEGKYTEVKKSVFIKLDNGQERDLHEILINVMNMWLIELEKLNLIDHIKEFQYRSIRIPRRKKDSGKMDLTAMQNLRFAPKFKIQKYNYDTKIIEPIDLTGAEISARFYKPQIIADLELTEKNGIKHNFEILVDQKQKKLIEKMKDENEKHQFLIKLAIEQNLIKIKKEK